MAKKAKAETDIDALKGWHEISSFLSQPPSVAQRWAHFSSMPVERKGRYVYSSRAKLKQWLKHESAEESIQIVGNETDLTAALKRGLSYVRKHQSRGN
jgi:hypothetical protein